MGNKVRIRGPAWQILLKRSAREEGGKFCIQKCSKMRKISPFPANEAALALRVEEVSTSTDYFAPVAQPVDEPLPKAAIILVPVTDSIPYPAFLAAVRFHLA